VKLKLKSLALSVSTGSAICLPAASVKIFAKQIFHKSHE